MDTSTSIECLRALAQEHRLAAFRALVQAGPEGLGVGELRERLGIPGPTLSAHLNQLRAAGLVSSRRDSRNIQVSANFEQMNALLGFLTENCCGEAEPGCTAVCPPSSEPAKP